MRHVLLVSLHPTDPQPQIRRYQQPQCPVRGMAMTVLVCAHLLLVALPMVTCAPYLGSQSPERPTAPFSRWQDSPESYGWLDNVAVDAQSVTSCEAPRGEAMIQEFFSTALAEYLARGTAQGRRRVSQEPEPPKTCTETTDCKEEAGTACCWVPGGNDTRSCVPEVPTSSVAVEVTEKAHSRQEMLNGVRYQISAFYLMPRSSLKVLVLPVGQGHCVAMYCPNGDLVMYDCGTWRDDKAVLSATEVKSVMGQVQRATIFISHGDFDHYNYLPTVFSDIEKVDRVIIGGNPNDYKNKRGVNIRQWLQRIASQGKLYAINRCEKCIGDCNDKLHTVPADSLAHCATTDSRMTSLNDMNICGSPDISFDIIAANVNNKDKNQQSIVMKVTAGSRSVLFSGDMENSAARTIARRVPVRLQANIFQISHHGAEKYANKCEWLKAIRPEEAFVSHAFNGRYKHPQCNAIQRLISIGSVNTDVHNTLPFHCARGRNQGDLAIGRICHRIFSTCPAEDTICTVLFALGEYPYTTHTCYNMTGSVAQEYEY